MQSLQSLQAVPSSVETTPMPQPTHAVTRLRTNSHGLCAPLALYCTNYLSATCSDIYKPALRLQPPLTTLPRFGISYIIRVIRARRKCETFFWWACVESIVLFWLFFFYREFLWLLFRDSFIQAKITKVSSFLLLCVCFFLFWIFWILFCNSYIFIFEVKRVE